MHVLWNICTLHQEAGRGARSSKTISLQPGRCSTPQETPPPPPHHHHHHHCHLHLSGAWQGMGEWSKGSNPYPQLIFIKGLNFATPSDFYVDDNKNMNLSCWGIKIHHPLWLLRWQGSLHQLIFLRDQTCHPLWLICGVIYDICAMYYYVLRPLLIPMRSNVGVAANNSHEWSPQKNSLSSTSKPFSSSAPP